MKTKAKPPPKAKNTNRSATAQRVTVNGRRMVMLPEGDYDRLLNKADEWEPPMPLPGADGNYPALEFAATSIARGILRARRKLGLSQVELARRAGIRPETLNRVEHGKHQPSVPTITKIEKALREAEGA